VIVSAGSFTNTFGLHDRISGPFRATLGAGQRLRELTEEIASIYRAFPGLRGTQVAARPKVHTDRVDPARAMAVTVRHARNAVAER
jgi:hypothetical protein